MSTRLVSAAFAVVFAVFVTGCGKEQPGAPVVVATTTAPEATIRKNAELDAAHREELASSHIARLASLLAD